MNFFFRSIAKIFHSNISHPNLGIPAYTHGGGGALTNGRGDRYDEQQTLTSEFTRAISHWNFILFFFVL